MRILLDDNPALYQIISVTRDYVQVNDQKLTSPFILSPTQLIHWEITSNLAFNNLDELDCKDFDFLNLLNTKPEVLLLATGITLKIPPDPLLKFLYTQEIGVEFMDTRSACHTFSILSSENRKVVACFLIK